MFCPFCNEAVPANPDGSDYHIHEYANCTLSGFGFTRLGWEYRKAIKGDTKPIDEESMNLDQAEKVIKWLKQNDLRVN